MPRCIVIRHFYSKIVIRPKNYLGDLRRIILDDCSGVTSEILTNVPRHLEYWWNVLNATECITFITFPMIKHQVKKYMCKFIFQ